MTYQGLPLKSCEVSYYRGQPQSVSILTQCREDSDHLRKGSIRSIAAVSYELTKLLPELRRVHDAGCSLLAQLVVVASQRCMSDLQIHILEQ